MRATDILLAVSVAVLWGAAFPAIAVGLESFSPGQLVTLRFLFAAIPVLFLARPALPWRSLLRRFPAASVAPYALLAPCVGMALSVVLFGEQFGALRYSGLGLVLLGLALTLLPQPLPKPVPRSRGLH